MADQSPWDQENRQLIATLDQVAESLDVAAIFNQIDQVAKKLKGINEEQRAKFLKYSKWWAKGFLMSYHRRADPSKRINPDDFVNTIEHLYEQVVRTEDDIMKNAKRKRQIRKLKRKLVAIDFPEQFTEEFRQKYPEKQKAPGDWRTQAITDTVMYKISKDNQFLRSYYENRFKDMQKRAIEMIKVDQDTPEEQKNAMIHNILKIDNKQRLIKYVKDSMLYYGRMGVSHYGSVINKILAFADELDQKGFSEQSAMIDNVFIQLAETKKVIAACKDRYMADEHNFKKMSPPGGGKENKFGGCVRYQMSCNDKSQESAEKICAAIKRRKYGENFGLAGDAKEDQGTIVERENRKAYHNIQPATVEEVKNKAKELGYQNICEYADKYKVSREIQEQLGCKVIEGETKIRVTIAQMMNICKKCAHEMVEEGLEYAEFDFDPQLEKAVSELQGE